MVTLIADPPAAPCSALKLPVTTLTLSTASVGGTYAIRLARRGKVSIAPSMRVVFVALDTPFTLTAIARAGLLAAEFCSCGGDDPGTSAYKAWKLRPVVENVGRFFTCSGE